MDRQLDDFDLKILRAISEDGRISWSELADRIGLSLTPTLRRVRAMEASGLIRGYYAALDEAALGGAISVFVSVSLEVQTDEGLALFESHVLAIENVMNCYMMTGPSDYLLRVVVPNLDGFQSFISKLARVPGVSRLSSSFAIKSVVRRAAPPLSAT